MTCGKPRFRAEFVFVNAPYEIGSCADMERTVTAITDNLNEAGNRMRLSTQAEGCKFALAGAEATIRQKNRGAPTFAHPGGQGGEFDPAPSGLARGRPFRPMGSDPARIP